MENILGLTLDEIKEGYRLTPDKNYICLTCGKAFEIGEVFPLEGRFFEASAACRHHVRSEHGDRVAHLSSLDKKLTGLTANQKELLMMMAEGMADNAIAQKTGVSAATIRHQRFAFREKAKQAKLYLALFELVDEAAQSKGKGNRSALIPVHTGAKMVDDRYLITLSEEEKILESAFESLIPLKLKVFSAKEKKKIVILRRIATQFQKGVKYTEKEVNAVIKPIYEDYATIRRYLIEYGFMDRTNDCKEYWLK
jgi:DNA-binding CsgD family transcriptional regulator